MSKPSKPQLCSGLEAQLLFASRVDDATLARLHERLLDFLNSDEFLFETEGANRVYASVKFGEFDIAKTAESLRNELAKL